MLTKMKEVYFSLGSNMGDRVETINKALTLMKEKFEKKSGKKISRTEVSSMYETDPWGFESENKFINCAAMFETDLKCRDILEICKDIEKELGRDITTPKYDENGRRIYKSRPIDIDILLYGDEKIEEPGLKVPHERMWERDFVMTPLKEIYGELNTNI